MPMLTVYAFVCTSITSRCYPSGCTSLLTMILLFMDKKILIYRICVCCRGSVFIVLSIDKAPIYGILRFNRHVLIDLEAYLKYNEHSIIYFFFLIIRPNKFNLSIQNIFRKYT